jgi:hypothetical protein
LFLPEGAEHSPEFENGMLVFLNRGLLESVGLEPVLPSGTVAWGWGIPFESRHFRCV